MRVKGLARVLRNAALKVEREENTYSCLAITHARHDERGDVLESYRASPDVAAYIRIMGMESPEDLQEAIERGSSWSKMRDLRVLALSFAAAVAATGDIPNAE